MLNEYKVYKINDIMRYLSKFNKFNQLSLFKRWIIRSLFSKSTNKTFIENNNLPPCINCIHFIEYKNKNSLLDDISSYGKCKLFGEKNIVSGQINYSFASFCRDNNKQCGLDGKYFEQIFNK